MCKVVPLPAGEQVFSQLLHRFRPRFGALWSVSRSIRPIACGDEVVSAFLWLEQIADGTDVSPQGLIGSGGGLADQGFQLGEGMFD
jgi:hypothetical protein